MTAKKSNDVVRPIPRKKLSKKAREDLDKLQGAFGDDAEVIPVEKGIVKRLEQAGTGAVDYVDQESEWDDARFLQEESETRQVYESFTGGEDKGISGKTDLTPMQAVALTHLRVMQKNFERRKMQWMTDEIGTMAEWLETYRLSIHRGSRKEAVEILRGRMELGRRDEVQPGANPTRFG